MEISSCPRCSKPTTPTSNRLITEKCGHIKCRECFIDDLNGCLDCAKESRTSADPIDNFTISLGNCTNENIADVESNSGDLCIDTDSENSSPKNDQNVEHFVGTGIVPDGLKTTDDINFMHNYSSKDSLESATANKEKLQILEQLIIAPKTKIEMFFRETEPKVEDSTASKRARKTADHIVKIVENGKTVFECTICNKKFRSKSQQYYHMYCGNEEQKPYKCKTCNKRFASSSHLNYHLETHNETKKYPCSLCPKIFLRKVSLQIHNKTHLGIYKFTCNECRISFNDRKSYVAHKNKHKNIYPFVCKMCGKKFSFKSNLTQHELTHTATAKRFRCEDCGREFGRKNSYKEHKVRHSKVKGFPCAICLKPFIDRKTLGRHMKTHGGSDVYMCPCCDVKSARKDNLIRHMRNMHPKENLKEILDKISVSTEIRYIEESNNSTEVAIETSSKEIETMESAEPKVDSIESQRQIVVSSSVIRSVGNVKPVQILNDCDLDINFIQNGNIAPPDGATKVLQTENPVKKKLKKKYDPCEMYRKILFAGNDCDDSLLETEELYADSKDDHIGCCETEIGTGSSDNGRDNNDHYSFTAMHWRKRTSQYFQK